MFLSDEPLSNLYASLRGQMRVEIAGLHARLGATSVYFSFPVSAGSDGQCGANSSTTGVYAACVKLLEAVAQAAGIDSTRAVFANGKVRSGNKSVALA